MASLQKLTPAKLRLTANDRPTPGTAPQITIRPATNADVETVKTLVFATLREYGLEPDTCNTDADLDDLEVNYFGRGGVFEVLVETTGEVLGTVGLYPLDEHTIELRKMYFAPELRGHGIGKQTLLRMVARARELGYQRMCLETNTILREAVELYKKFGFVETAEKHSPRCNQAFVLEL